MNDFDIVIPVMGNLEVVKECMESLHPLPPNWHLYVYDSDLSAIDGTKAYLLEKQVEYNFTIIDDNKRLGHGPAVERLISVSSSPWILHLDSDAKLLDRNFFSLVEKMVNDHKFKVWGRVALSPGRPQMDTEFTIVLPRTYSWNIMFERKFMKDSRLSFSPKRIEKKIIFDGKSKNLLFWGDTSWELYWESSRKDLFGRYPDDVWKCFEHKDHSTVNWKAQNIEKIKNFDITRKNASNQ